MSASAEMTLERYRDWASTQWVTCSSERVTLGAARLQLFGRVGDDETRVVYRGKDLYRGPSERAIEIFNATLRRPDWPDVVGSECPHCNAPLASVPGYILKCPSCSYGWDLEGEEVT